MDVDFLPIGVSPTQTVRISHERGIELSVSIH